MLAAVFIAGALLAPIVAVAAKAKAKRQESWSRAVGRVLVSKVDYWSGSTQAVVEYTYIHEGRSYWSNRISWPQLSMYLPSGARKAISRFPVGAAITVFVDPQKPERSVLVPGGDRRLLPAVLAFSLAFLLAGLKLLREA